VNAGRFWPACLRAAAIGSFVVYCLWWGYWLAHGRLAPALFLAMTGLPAPTTGMSRALRAFVNGHWRESMAYNALTLPILGLTALSLGHAALQALRRRPMVLPQWIVRSWALVLVVAWILKLAGPRQYW
jgi:Protein of unknown function (DUF2752)